MISIGREKEGLQAGKLLKPCRGVPIGEVITAKVPEAGRFGGEKNRNPTAEPGAKGAIHVTQHPQ
jgi:hypothetical protein